MSTKLTIVLLVVLVCATGTLSAVPPPMQAQCWSPPVNRLGRPWPFENMSSMNWANCGSSKPADTASEASDRLVGRRSRLGTNPRGAVLLYGYCWSKPVASATYANLLAGVPDCSQDYRFFLDAFRGLAARGAEPPLIVTDFESAEPAGWNWLDSMQNIQQATRNSARAEYESISKAARDAGFTGTPPLVVGSGICPAATDYIDANGLRYVPCGVPGYSPDGVHSPQTYFAGGKAYEGGPLDSRWENFRGAVEEIESGALGANPPMPWIAYTSFHGDGQPTERAPTNLQIWMQARLVLHARAAGCTVLLYFNPKGRPIPDDSYFAAALQAANASVQSVATSITPEAKGSLSVSTGPVTSTYAEFQEALRLDEKATNGR